MSGGPRLRIERGEAAAGIAEIVLDDRDRAVNVISTAVVDELDQALDEIGRDTGVRAVLLRSAKESCFVAGADLSEIAEVEEASIALGHAARVQGLLRRLEQLPVPVVAAVRGACLGGGLELALACHLRLASDEPATRLGLPEVKLGLLPGFGGTQRLPRLVGIRRATNMILKGYAVGAGEARRMGLVDRLLGPERFTDLARAETLALVRGERRLPRRRLAAADRLLATVGPVRDLYFRLAERSVRQQTRGLYPAPEKAIAAMREGLRLPLDEGLEVEAGLVGALAVSPECKGLVRVFFLSEASKRDPGVDLSAARPVAKLGVVGAGVMGAGIAALAARSGLPVRLKDVSAEALGRGLKSAAAQLGAGPGRGGREGSRALGRISPTVEPRGFAQATVVIEAVVEDLALKRDVLEEIEAQLGPDAVFASNTSALSVSELSRSARRPERVVGMHFFNPVAKMPLVEVVRGDSTAPWALATVVLLSRELGKVPVVVADAPGFLVNRVLAPYLGEALALTLEGTEPLAIEQAMLDFGLPMGPLELVDEVGLDVARHVAATLAQAFPDRLASSPLIEAMVAAGRLGRKSGLGFYRHRGRRKSLDPGLGRLLRTLGTRPRREAPARGALQERLILSMVNEACRALEEGVVRTPGEVDLAMVLGTGFPPFRGGLMAFAASLGVGPVLASLERLESSHGERFRPAPLIAALGRAGKGFLDAADLLR